MDNTFNGHSAWPPECLAAIKKSADKYMEAFKLSQQLAALTESQKLGLINDMFASTDEIVKGTRRMLAESLCRERRMLNTNYTPESGFDFVRELQRRKAVAEQQREERETLKLSKILDQDTLFRFAYVPFVIAELVWDYADTILTLSAMMRNGAKKLCRAVKELRRDYDRERTPYIDEAHRDSEVENMYVFEDGVKDIYSQMLVNLRCDLKSEYPSLDNDSVDFLTAVYQCDITMQSLLIYTRKQTEKIERIVGHRIGNILPKQMYQLARLIPEFAGDKSASDRFKTLKKQYEQTFATQIALIELSDEALND